MILPAVDSEYSQPAHFFWTSTRKDMRPENWIPNHFVPLVENDAPVNHLHVPTSVSKPENRASVSISNDRDSVSIWNDGDSVSISNDGDSVSISDDGASVSISDDGASVSVPEVLVSLPLEVSITKPVEVVTVRNPDHEWISDPER
jgi:hypothetical protein